jgi:hypothetical protein
MRVAISASAALFWITTIYISPNKISVVDGFRLPGTSTSVRTSQSKSLSSHFCSAFVSTRHAAPLCCCAVNIDIESSSSSSSSSSGGEQEPFLDDKNGSLLHSHTRRTPHKTARRAFEAYGELPWSSTQEWALRDNLSKYSFRLVWNGTLQRLVRWRTLVNHTPELTGYPIDFVISHYEALTTTDEYDDSSSSLFGLSSQLLPYIDKFRFESNGGLSGDAFGVRGIQDGTRIRTNPVVNVENSIPLGYVVTEDGSVVYELGQPDSSMDVASTVQAAAYTSRSNNLETTTTTKKGELGNVLDPDLVQLAGLTAVVLTGAWAMQALSHHLTVNIFWV